MRYRALDENGDYTFGRGAGNFLVNTPDTVRQSIQTRLSLLQGEWYLDLTSGTPWSQEILGKNANGPYDLVIQTRILQTKGVSAIVNYQSSLDTSTRALSVAALVQTVYSLNPILVETSL